MQTLLYLILTMAALTSTPVAPESNDPEQATAPTYITGSY